MLDCEKIESPELALFNLTKKYGSGLPESDAPLKRIFQIVLTQGCKTVVEEQDYNDEEWGSEHNVFYSKLFTRHADKTKRLHFFKSEIEKEALCRLEELQSSYLGFCTLRPTKVQKVVNAIVSPIKDKNVPEKSFVLCQEDYPVEICTNKEDSQKLTIRGFPFIQQDGFAACCADVALVMMDRFLVQQKNKETGNKDKAHTSGEISDFVSSVPSVLRRRPSSGLNELEVAEALRKMGYAPLVYCFSKDTRSQFPLERVIYHYLESKIPIYVSIPTATSRHALTIVGHSFEPDTWWELAETEYYKRQPSGGSYHCSTDWIPNFIVHDDNFGPYLVIPKEFLWEREEHAAVTIVVPLPHKIASDDERPELIINMNGEHAEALANSLFQSVTILGCIMSDPQSGESEISRCVRDIYRGLVSEKTIKWSEILKKHYERKDLVLRTCLLARDDFIGNYVPPHLVPFYGNVQLPKKIWLTEISIPELFSHSRSRLGEIIMDPTAPLTPPATYLVIHLPGLFITGDIDEDSDFPPFDFIADDPPCTHVIRR